MLYFERAPCTCFYFGCGGAILGPSVKYPRYQNRKKTIYKENWWNVLAIEKLNMWTSTSFSGLFISWLKAGFSLDLIPVINMNRVFLRMEKKQSNWIYISFCTHCQQGLWQGKRELLQNHSHKKIQDYTFVTSATRFYIMVHCNVFLESFFKRHLNLQRRTIAFFCKIFENKLQKNVTPFHSIEYPKNRKYLNLINLINLLKFLCW